MNNREKVILKFAKCREGAKIPYKKRITDAGLDAYAFLPDFVDNRDYIIVRPGQTIILPTGIKSIIPEGYFISIRERSSVGSLGIGKRSGEIDSEYRGEWKIVVTNHNHSSFVIFRPGKSENFPELTTKYAYHDLGNAIAQLILEEVIPTEVEEVSEEEINKDITSRGINGFGSTNTINKVQGEF